jgi:hypothetical protein
MGCWWPGGRSARSAGPWASAKRRLRAWRHQYGGMKAEEAKRLKNLLAEAELDKAILKEAFGGKLTQFCTPAGEGGSRAAEPGDQRTTGAHSVGAAATNPALSTEGQGAGASVSGADARVGMRASEPWVSAHLGAVARGWAGNRPSVSIGCGGVGAELTLHPLRRHSLWRRQSRS